ncbi:hypothetical protein, partial [Inquilinus sp. OTU3971]|uniref:hypothetical protein n=1 Tax=Inquilinus sp. OTU3971 TaxID=3043855 RepID=UPI00313C11EC
MQFPARTAPETQDEARLNALNDSVMQLQQELRSARGEIDTLNERLAEAAVAQPRRGGVLGWAAAAVIAMLGIGGIALMGFGSREPAAPGPSPTWAGTPATAAAAQPPAPPAAPARAAALAAVTPPAEPTTVAQTGATTAPEPATPAAAALVAPAAPAPATPPAAPTITAQADAGAARAAGGPPPPPPPRGGAGI